MESQVLHDAIFRLGWLSGDSTITNDSLLKRISEIVARTLGVESAGVAVCENGIERGVTRAAAFGMWANGPAHLSEAEAAARILGGFAGELGTTHLPDTGENFGDGPCQCELVYSEMHRPMRLADHATVVFRRNDGVELVIVISTGPSNEPISRDTLATASSLVGAAAQAWSSSWHKEPAWMASLSPSSRRVLESLLEGCDDDQIADRTGLTYHSVRAHLKRIFRDAGVRSRLHLIQQCRTGARASAFESLRPSTRGGLPAVTVIAGAGNGVYARTG